MLSRSALLLCIAALATPTSALFLFIPEPPHANTSAAIAAIANINLSGPVSKGAATPRLSARQDKGINLGNNQCTTECSSTSDTAALQAVLACTTATCKCDTLAQVSSSCIECSLKAIGIDMSAADFNQQCLVLATTDTPTAGADCSTTCQTAGDQAALASIAKCDLADFSCVCPSYTTLASDPPCLACLFASAAVPPNQQAALAQQCAAVSSTEVSSSDKSASSSLVATGTLPAVTSVSAKVTGAATSTPPLSTKPTGSNTSASGSASASASGSGASGAGLRVQSGWATAGAGLATVAVCALFA